MRSKSPCHGAAALYRAGVAVLTTLLLTSVHHLYGARRFDTPWRAHVAHIAAWAGAVFGICLVTALRRPDTQAGRRAMATFAGLAVAICAVWLGLYEGGYNHGMKNLVAAAHVSPDLVEQLFPRATYEPPGDWVFEVSGILQLPIGLFAGRAAWRAYRTLARKRRS